MKHTPYIRPKKSLGQHFLTDMNIARKIVDSLTKTENYTIIEIGPGKGILSQFLVEKKFKQLFLIEIDTECIEFLERSFSLPNVQIIQDDFLKIGMERYGSSALSIIGNLPYHISSQIFFKILENRQKVEEVVCMVQKEVAERICAKPGNKQYGILSVILQAYYHTHILFTVNAGVFFPPPKVKSAVMKLTRNQTISLSCNEELFIKIVKQAFNQRRKILRNSLSAYINESITDPIFLLRPEQLDVERFVYLTNLLDNLL